MKKKIIISILITLFVVLLGYTIYSIFFTSSIKITLIDAETSQPIIDTDIRIYSDNGIRCFQAPCPTDSKQWNGTTNDNGSIYVPSDVINIETNIFIEGSSSIHRLDEKTDKISNNEWLIKFER